MPAAKRRTTAPPISRWHDRHMPIATRSFSHVRVTVTDIERSRAFYEDIFAWTVAFELPADADAAVSTATRLGASVVMPPEDTPFGRLATIADPTGAQLKLMGPAR